MTRRRTFEIDLPDAADEPVPSPAPPADPGSSLRRGPMAEAVRENADALRARAAAEARIRAENDALAHEFVRARAAGLVLELIATGDVDATKLARDRAPGPDPELAELKASILALGLSNPIRVEKRADGRYELIQGWRRLRAFVELEAEHRDGRFARIPAARVADGEALRTSYRRMVDENMVRRDVSFAEMARLALAYAADPALDCPDVDRAVAELYRSAGYQKRSYVRAFADLLGLIGDALRFPQAIGRNLGLDLRRRLEADPRALAALRAALAADPGRDAEAELALLRACAEGRPLGPPPGPTPPKAPPRPGRALRLDTGAFRLVADKGRIELRCAADFAAIDPERLEAAAAAFLDALGVGREDERGGGAGG